MKIIGYALVLITLAASCKTQNSDEKISDVLTGTYQVSMLNGEDVLSKGLTVILDYSTKKISGNSGCNSYFGNFELSENRITFKNIGKTKMYCIEKEKNEIEQKFISILSHVFEITSKTDKLELLGNDENKSKIILSKS